MQIWNYYIYILRYTVPVHDINYRSGKNVRVDFSIPEQWKEYTALRMRWHMQKPDTIFCEMVCPSILVGVSSVNWEPRLCVCKWVRTCASECARVRACMRVCSFECVHVCASTRTSVCVCGPWWTGDVPQSWCAYWITTPFSSFPFTTTPIFCCVPSCTNWPLHMNTIPEMLFCSPPFLQTVVLTIFQHEWNSVRSLCSVFLITSFIYLLFVCLFKVVFKCHCVHMN